MKPLSFSLCALALLCGTVSAQKFDFENISQLKPGGIGSTYVNPTGSFTLDTTPANAHGGCNAVKLTDNGRITMDFRPVVPGETYRLSAFVKGSGKAVLQIEWLGGDKPANYYQVLPLDTGKYRRIVLDAAAPAGAKHAYLKFYNADAGKSLWIDDIEMAIRPVAANAALIDFELPLLGPGGVGNCYVNPTGSFTYDDSGKNADKGIGAMKLAAKGRITVDYKKVVPGKLYRLSARVKGRGTGFIQLQWQGKLAKPQVDTKRISLTGTYENAAVQGVAPAGTTHVYFQIYTTGNDSEMWVDEINLEEPAPAAAPTAALEIRFNGAHARFPVYPSGSEIAATIHGSGKLPARDQLVWALCDYTDKKIRSGVLPVTSQSLATGIPFHLPADLPSGGFFLHMHLADSGVTIAAKGSRPPRFAAFGILPAIKSLPLDVPEHSRFGAQGTNFIAGGEFMRGDSLNPVYPVIGMKWTYMGGSGLCDLEPSPGAFRPKNAAEYSRAPRPETARLGMAEIHDLYGVPRHLLRIPDYVKITGKINRVQAQSYPLADPAGYADLVGRAARDLAARREAFFPERRHNYYQIHWEPDWHWNGTEDEFIAYYRAAHPAIKANDPAGLLLGANYGVAERAADKMESMFAKGLGKYLDGILVHLYFLPVAREPEEAGLHRSCRKIRQLADRYIRPGAPILNTEWGVDYRGKDTADVKMADFQNHLSRFLRGHLIALGEGFDATWFFYTTDYNLYESTTGEQGYGISFNTSDYIKKHQFGANALEPKPTMMGAAAMTRLLEGTRSLGRYDALPENIFAYSFRRGEDNLLVLWTPDETPRQVTLATGVEQLRAFDCMGNETRLPSPGGKLTLTLTRYPQYLLGIADKALATRLPLRDARPGELSLDRAPGVYFAEIDGQLQQLRVRPPVELSLPVESLNAAGKLQFCVPVRNLTASPETISLHGLFNGREFAATTVKLPANGSCDVILDGSRLEDTGMQPGELRIAARQGEKELGRIERSFGHLIAYPATPVALDGRLTDHPPVGWSRRFGSDAITYQKQRYKNERDFSARYRLLADAKNVYLAVAVQDDVALPAILRDMPWRNDALLIAIGRNSNGKGEFAECRKFAFMRGAGNSVIAQEIFGTPPKAVRDSNLIACAIRRNEDARQTVYELAIPRTLFGDMAQRSGLGITLHDVDSEAEAKGDIHRQMSLAGGVPLFMGNVKFATLLLPASDARPEAAIWPEAQRRRKPEFRKSEFPDSDEPDMQSLIFRGIDTPDGKPTDVFAYYACPVTPPPTGGYPAVLMIHGGGGTAYADYAREFVRRGYAVLAPDLNGKRPIAANPRKLRSTLPRGNAEEEQYQSVGNLLAAHELLRSRPEINPSKIALVGISWGAVFSEIAASLDDRFAVVIPVYGCGFWNAGDASSNFGKNQRNRWFDPGNFVSRIASPVYAIVGADDGSFGRDSWLQTVAAIPNCRFLMMPHLPHSHQGFRLAQIDRAIQAVWNGKPIAPQFTGKPQMSHDGQKLEVTCATLPADVRAELLIVEDTTRPVQQRTYRALPAQIGKDRLSAELPATAQEGYFLISSANGENLSSSLLWRRNP